MSEQPGNFHRETYSAANVEVGQGCLNVLSRLNYYDGIAVDFDNVKWQRVGEDTFKAVIGDTSLVVPAPSKTALDSCIPFCQEIKATKQLNQVVFHIMPWFISHQAIWIRSDLEKEEIVAVYTTPPNASSPIKDGLSMHYLVAQNAAGMFFSFKTAAFLLQWGSSGMDYKAVIEPL